MSGLTFDLVERIAVEVEKGNYPEVVAGSMGLDKAYFSKSWTLGQEVGARPSFPEGVSDYEMVCATLAWRLEQAGNIAELTLLSKAAEHAEKGRSTWTFFVTVLERTRPGWQRKDKLEAPGRSVEDELAEIEARKAARDAAA